MDNIIILDTIRIDRKVPKKCTCGTRRYIIDTENREITCGCGMVADPFEAMLDLANQYEDINMEHHALNEQRRQWLKEKPYSVIFKDLERSYSRGTMLPSCPKCKETFDFKEITFWVNAEFYRKLEQRKREWSE